MNPIATIFSLLAATFFGAGDFCGGLAVRRAGLMATLIASQGAGAVLLFVLAIVSSPLRIAPLDVALAALAGLCAALGIAALYRGLATGIVAVVAPVSAVLAALVPAIVGALGGEAPPLSAMAGAALCLPAVAILSWQDEEAGGRAAVRSSLISGALAGILLGAAFAGIALMRSEAGLWPLFAMRLSAFAAVLLFYAAQAVLRAGGSAAGGTMAGQPEHRLQPKHEPAPQKRSSGSLFFLAAALASGALDASGTAAFRAASGSGPLMIVSVMTSLYPAITVLLARAFFAQRIGPRRAAGLVLALAGICLVGLR